MWTLLTLLKSVLPVKYLFRKDLTVYTCFDSRSGTEGTVVKNVALGQVYVRGLRFSLVSNIARLLIPHTSEAYHRHSAGVNLGDNSVVKQKNSVPLKIYFIGLWNVEKFHFYILVMHFPNVLLLQVRFSCLIKLKQYIFAWNFTNLYKKFQSSRGLVWRPMKYACRIDFSLIANVTRDRSVSRGLSLP
jgi:hypothetical protein